MSKTELTVVQRAAVALGASEHEKSLIDLVAQSATIVAIKNSAGREQCHRALMTIRDARVNLQKVGKDARDDATKFSKAIIAEENRLIALISPEETRLQEIRDAWDAEREAEKQAKLQAEARRVAAIRALIEEIRMAPGACPGKTSAELIEHAEDLARQPITLELFQELSGEAEVVRETAVEQLRLMAKLAFDREEEKARMIAERAELEKLRAEQAERDRVAAAERAEQERIDRERRDAEEAARRVALDKADAIMRAEREAHEARMAAERAAMQRQQDEAAAEQRRRQKEIDAEQAAARAELQREQDALAAQRRAEADAAAAKWRAVDLAAAKMLRDQQELAERERIAREASDTAVRNAAPALCSALNAMMDCFVDDPLSYEHTRDAVIEAARDALALARGEVAA
jgi:hypothetical protein